MIVPIAAVMISAVSKARTRVRRTALRKLVSLRSAKRAASRSSWPKACTVGIALRISPASAEASAMRSCESRDSARTRRPISTIGSTSRVISPNTRPKSCTLVAASITMPPTNWNRLRSPIDTELPTTACTSVVSPVSRDSTSPVCKVSKNCGDWRSTRAYTARRRSAVTRSPIHDTM
jgi:hypothetical protein